MPPQVLTELSPKVAFIIASVVIAIMGVTMIGFGWVPHLSLMLAMVVLLGLGMYKGLSIMVLISSHRSIIIFRLLF